MCKEESLDTKQMSRFRQLVADATVDINFKTGYGETPLLLLCSRNQSGSLLPALQTLLRRRDVDLRLNYSGYSALNLLIRLYRQPHLIHCISLLIGREINVNEMDGDGQSAITILCHLYTGDDLIDIARLLVRNFVMADCPIVDKCASILMNRGFRQEFTILKELASMPLGFNRDPPMNQVRQFSFIPFIQISLVYLQNNYFYRRKRNWSHCAVSVAAVYQP